MLLRVRLASGGTLKLRVDADLSYAAALELIATEAKLSPTGLSLSLNRREPLAATPSTSICSIGLSPGDLVYLLGGPEAPAPLQPLAAAALPHDSFSRVTGNPHSVAAHSFAHAQSANRYAPVPAKSLRGLGP